jgi:hypothetical protein
MLQFNEHFIGSTLPNKLHNTPCGIIHQYNKFGHRTKQIEDLDTNNYILFTGCSHTEGAGLEIDQIYTHHVAKMTNMDYYNMGLGSSGNDIIFYNLMSWLTKYSHKPKLIVIQWSYSFRYARFIESSNIDNIETEGSWSKNECAKFTVWGENIGYFSLHNKMYYNLIKQLNIPTINIVIPSNEQVDFITDNYIPMVWIDYAKDNMHTGIKSNLLQSEKIINHIKNKGILI